MRLAISVSMIPWTITLASCEMTEVRFSGRISPFALLQVNCMCTKKIAAFMTLRSPPLPLSCFLTDQNDILQIRNSQRLRIGLRRRQSARSDRNWSTPTVE